MTAPAECRTPAALQGHPSLHEERPREERPREERHREERHREDLSCGELSCEGLSPEAQTELTHDAVDATAVRVSPSVSQPTSRERELEAQIEAMHAELMHAQKMSSIGALTSSVTHEFNNVLTTVINYAKMGLRHDDPDKKKRSFEKILAAGQRAAAITTGMLALARGDGGRRESTPLGRLVHDVLVLCEKDLVKHRIGVRLELEDDPSAVVSAAQVQQVLLNFVVNARQAMGESGTLLIRTRTVAETRTAELTVRDTGPGIPAESLTKIFEPFYSTKDRDSDGRGGTGLGLSLCKDIIEAHGGRIRVQTALGKGTAFTLCFPLSV